MRTVRFGFAALLAAASTVALAQEPAPPEFSPEAVKAHVTFLADDLLEGRDAGTRGYDIAAHYVASQFAQLGLRPANGESWYQPVPLIEQAPDTAHPPLLTIGGTRFEQGKEALVRISGEGAQKWAGDAVFVGYGLESEEHGLDDYAGLDVKGKAVVLFYGAPKGLPSDVAASLNSRKGKTAAAHGATAIITLLDSETMKRFPWDTIRAQGDRPSTGLMNPDGTPHRENPEIKAQALLSPAAAEALFAGAPTPFKTVLAASDKGAAMKGFALTQPVTIEGSNVWRRFTSPNVVGMIPGSDPKLAAERVLLMAHLDHEGVSPEAPGEDKIWNGAMDNAAGVASMLEAARAFTESGERPKRTLLFAAVTAEEDGLLGSEYLAKHPVVRDGRVAAVVNLDMPVLLYDFTDVVAFGAEHSTLGPLVAKAAAASGVTLSPDPMPEENLFVRSDHYSFVQQGVPSVFLVTGFANGGEKAFKTFLSTHYHKPSDEVTLPFDWQAGAKFAEVNYAIARAIADAPEPPRWYADSIFGDRFAKDQPKAQRPE